jgi:hypothetical protein
VKIPTCDEIRKPIQIRQFDLFEVESQSSSAGPLIGLRVKIQGGHCNCGEELAVLGSSSGPHAAAILCACGAHRGWLGHEIANAIARVIKEFGRPDEPIVLRRGA